MRTKKLHSILTFKKWVSLNDGVSSFIPAKDVIQSEWNQGDTYMLLYSRNEASENNRSGPKGIMTTPTNAASGASGCNIGLM